MTLEQKVAALEMTVNILVARLDELEKHSIVDVLPGTGTGEIEPEEETFADPDEFYFSLFDMPLGEIFPGIFLVNVYGHKLLLIGNQYLGIGASLDSRYKLIPVALMDLMTNECGEQWYHRFQRYQDQSGLSTSGTGVPFALGCKRGKWKS